MRSVLTSQGRPLVAGSGSARTHRAKGKSRRRPRPTNVAALPGVPALRVRNDRSARPSSSARSVDPRSDRRAAGRPAAVRCAAGLMPEVPPGPGRGGPAARGPDDVPLADEVGLGDGLDGVGLLPHGDGQGRQTHRATAEAAAERLEHGPVEAVEADLVDVEEGEGRRGRGRSTWPSPCTCAQSRTRRSRRLAMRGVPRERPAISGMPALVGLDPEQPGRAVQDRHEVGDVVVVEVGGEPEAVAQRGGQQPGARRGPDDGERRAARAGWRSRPGPCRRSRRRGSPPWRGRASPRPSGSSGGSRRGRAPRPRRARTARRRGRPRAGWRARS